VTLNTAVFFKKKMPGGACALLPSHQLPSSPSLQLVSKLVPTILEINVPHTEN